MKIEIRTKCKICGKKITEKRFRTYCSTTCRNRANAIKHREYRTQWQKARREKISSVPSKDKVQCLVCGGWYVQLGSHVVQAHGFESCREYREEFDLERKKGIVPDWYRQMKGDMALENGTYKNLKKGKPFLFVEGDKRAGKYKRSHITIERLKKLHSLKK